MNASLQQNPRCFSGPTRPAQTLTLPPFSWILMPFASKPLHRSALQCAPFLRLLEVASSVDVLVGDSEIYRRARLSSPLGKHLVTRMRRQPACFIIHAFGGHFLAMDSVRFASGHGHEPQCTLHTGRTMVEWTTPDHDDSRPYRIQTTVGVSTSLMSS